MKRVIVTGATGFVGLALCRHLLNRNIPVTAAVRNRAAAERIPLGCRVALIGDLSYFADWNKVLASGSTVVHLAARTHRLEAKTPQDEDAFELANVEATRRLVDACRHANVARLVYLSSIKAVGEGDISDVRTCAPYDEAAKCRPRDLYGVTKCRAEQLVRTRLTGSSTTWSIIRPPLIYGPGAKGNLRRLVDWLQRGRPIPLAIKANARSLVSLRSLCRAIELCLTHSSASNELFHIADKQPVSTHDIVRHLAAGLQCSPRCIRLPASVLHGMARCTGRLETVQRWTGSLLVDTAKIERQLDWSPELNTGDGLQLVAAASRNSHVEGSRSAPGRHHVSYGPDPTVDVATMYGI